MTAGQAGSGLRLSGEPEVWGFLISAGAGKEPASCCASGTGYGSGAVGFTPPWAPTWPSLPLVPRRVPSQEGDLPGVGRGAGVLPPSPADCEPHRLAVCRAAASSSLSPLFPLPRAAVLRPSLVPPPRLCPPRQPPGRQEAASPAQVSGVGDRAACALILHPSLRRGLRGARQRPAALPAGSTCVFSLFPLLSGPAPTRESCGWLGWEEERRDGGAGRSPLRRRGVVEGRREGEAEPPRALVLCLEPGWEAEASPPRGVTAGGCSGVLVGLPAVFRQRLQGWLLSLGSSSPP